jgi:signal peptidase II
MTPEHPRTDKLLMTRPRERPVAWMGAAALTITVDLVSKVVASRTLQDHPMPIAGSFRLRLSHNSGVAFGLGRTLPAAVVLTLTALACIGIAVAAWRDLVRPSIPLGVVLGGAVANLLDRLQGGSVVDLLDVVRWWPIFNLADVAITVGGLAFFITSRRSDATQQAFLPAVGCSDAPPDGRAETLSP